MTAPDPLPWLDQLLAAHERWDTDAAGLDVATTDGEVWNTLFRRPRWMSGAEVHELVQLHNAVPELARLAREREALRTAVLALADELDQEATERERKADALPATSAYAAEVVRLATAAKHQRRTAARLRAVVATAIGRES